MFKATRVQTQTVQLSKATRPQRGRRKRHHQRHGRQQRVETSADEDPGSARQGRPPPRGGTLSRSAFPVGLPDPGA